MSIQGILGSFTELARTVGEGISEIGRQAHSLNNHIYTHIPLSELAVTDAVAAACFSILLQASPASALASPPLLALFGAGFIASIFLIPSNLHKAIREGNTAFALNYIEKLFSEELNNRDAQGSTPLHVAISMNQQNVARALIDKLEPSQLNEKTMGGETAYALAHRLHRDGLSKYILDKQQPKPPHALDYSSFSMSS